MVTLTPFVRRAEATRRRLPASAVRLCGMDRDFWLNAWNTQQTRFHESVVNPSLLAHRAVLPPPPARVFVPLAGKSLDLGWLTEQGYDVVAVEWSELAVRAFFEEHAWSPEVTTEGSFIAYRVPRLTFYCGDVFALDASQLAGVSAVYDRAALIALSPDVRPRYAAQLSAWLGTGGVILLVALERTVNPLAGPPFSVPEREVRALYEPKFSVERLASHEPDERGFLESVYRLDKLR